MSSNNARARQPNEESGRRKHPRRTLDMLALTGLGIGGIIGAGFFLGSGIVLRKVGPGSWITYLVAGIILAQVMGAITSLAMNIPVNTSYQEYIARYLGPYASFLLGWSVFVSGVLAIGSEAVAMAVYSRYWVPAIPLGVFAVGYVLVIIFLNTLGMANFSRAETAMALLKGGVLAAFIVVATLVTSRVLPSPHPNGLAMLTGKGGLFPAGPLAILRGMLIVIFSYAGVTTVAMATSRAKHPRVNIPRAALHTTIVVVLLYTLSMLGLALLVHVSQFTPHRSPFVTALTIYHYVWFARIFNAIILVASFSVMAATFYATEWMLISLAQQRTAPAFFRDSERGRPYPALVATSVVVLMTLVLAFVLPHTVYTDLTAASSYFSFVNWLLILLAFVVWHRRDRTSGQPVSTLAFASPYGAWVMTAVIVALGAYSVTVHSFQLGFFVFAAATIAISLVWWMFLRGHRPNLTTN